MSDEEKIKRVEAHPDNMDEYDEPLIVVNEGRPEEFAIRFRGWKLARISSAKLYHSLMAEFTGVKMDAKTLVAMRVFIVNWLMRSLELDQRTESGKPEVEYDPPACTHCEKKIPMTETVYVVGNVPRCSDCQDKITDPLVPTEEEMARLEAMDDLVDAAEMEEAVRALDERLCDNCGHTDPHTPECTHQPACGDNCKEWLPT